MVSAMNGSGVFGFRAISVVSLNLKSIACCFLEKMKKKSVGFFPEVEIVVI